MNLIYLSSHHPYSWPPLQISRHETHTCQPHRGAGDWAAIIAQQLLHLYLTNTWPVHWGWWLFNTRADQREVLAGEQTHGDVLLVEKELTKGVSVGVVCGGWSEWGSVCGGRTDWGVYVGTWLWWEDWGRVSLEVQFLQKITRFRYC